MIIKANVKYIPRVKVKCPEDRVHVAGKDGHIKGVHALWFDEKLIFKGSNGFFWPVDDWGYKVYFSFGWLGCAKKSFVAKERKNLKLLHEAGVAPEVGEITKVKIDIHYKGKHIVKTPYAVKTKVVQYPEGPWLAYAKGYAYNWGCIEDEWHSPASFIRFRKSVKKIVKALGLKFDGSLKLGDLMPDTVNETWKIVDGGS